MKHDHVELASNDVGERLAVSFAFAQSSLLSLYEWRLEQTITRNEGIPQTLATTGKIEMKKVDISKEIGRLFMERYSINLDSDINDEPSHFWDDDEWLGSYKRLAAYLDKSNRVELLNARLECIHDLLNLLMSQVEERHASRLEWIIIWLILVEVVIQVVWNMFLKDVLGLFKH